MLLSFLMHKEGLKRRNTLQGYQFGGGKFTVRAEGNHYHYRKRSSSKKQQRLNNLNHHYDHVVPVPRPRSNTSPNDQVRPSVHFQQPNAPPLSPPEDDSSSSNRRMTIPFIRLSERAPKMNELPFNYKRTIILSQDELNGPRGFLENVS